MNITKLWLKPWAVEIKVFRMIHPVKTKNKLWEITVLTCNEPRRRRRSCLDRVSESIWGWGARRGRALAWGLPPRWRKWRCHGVAEIEASLTKKFKQLNKVHTCTIYYIWVNERYGTSMTKLNGVHSLQHSLTPSVLFVNEEEPI